MAAIYAALGVSAASVALGPGVSSSRSQQQATSGVLAWPAGRVIVVVTGLMLIGVGVAHVVKGVKKHVRSPRRSTRRRCPPPASPSRNWDRQIGYVAKGRLWAWWVACSAIRQAFDRQKHGLDGAMQTILAQPFGRLLLTAAAFGFVAFGVFAILQSRYRRM